MNKEFMLYHLREASEQLAATIRELETDPEYEYGNLVVDMGHLYHHINSAWNARDSSDEEARECTEDNFIKWRQFPSGDEIYLGR